jgi:ATP-binding cassette subfamily B protein
LDPETERELLTSVRQNCAGGIIISHRIEPIKICDEIIVFDAGRIVQRGSHDQLVSEKDGFYAKLFNLEVK